MNTRTLIATILGITFGTVAGYHVASAGYGAFAVLLFWWFIGTLIVSRIANQRIILVGMIPNIVMLIVLTIVLQINHPDGLFAVVVGFVFWLILNILLSLLITVPMYFLRTYLKAKPRRASRGEA